ncbi:tripartite tricarboxylate transporter substrate binding protein [Aquabacterium sp. J223]|uniref:Bug family tripartite tricarboxylate transporter substrate binding protein n=1 Tax=Aquabacterium sp. J223 TaxID=2898431 RepID=UPI0021ADA871|nr:tripartite tricarboxylate transporter substrate binding protein [Aquabacterium sp. J223]UUX95205.1 tripartite tricarboxylate transporter substrate binding protein [Aquabacterium sp. J223]
MNAPNLPRRAVLVAMGGGLALAARPALAAWPEKPIRLIVPYPPGGITDVLGRSLAEAMRRELAQTVVVENKPGANSGLGAQALAASPADGYTVLLGAASTVVLNPMLNSKIGYDPREFTPVGRIADTPLVVVVKADSPLTSLADLLAAAKAQPGRLAYGSTGVGSSLHLAGELLQSATGTEMLHVPYKGSAPALNGVLSGETQFLVDSIGSSMPLIKGGRVRALAVTTAQRLPILPEVPTVAEAGVAGFDVSTWFGLFVPRQTPEEAVRRLNAAVASAVREAAFRTQFEGLGMIVSQPGSPQAFDRFIKAEAGKWAPLIKAKNIVLE